MCGGRERFGVATAHPWPTLARWAPLRPAEVHLGHLLQLTLNC